MAKQPFGILSDADKEQAMYQGLLGMGTQLMAASAPSLNPGGFAKGIAAGGRAFNQGYNGHLDATRNRQMSALKARTAEQQLEMNDATLKQNAAWGEMFKPKGGVETASMGPTNDAAAALEKTKPIYAAVPGLTSEQASALSMMQPGAGQKLIAEQAFKEPSKKTKEQQLAEFLYPNNPQRQHEYVAQITTMNKAPVVNVNGNGVDHGTPPSGMAWAYGENDKVRLDDRGIPVALPIAGGPLDQKRQAVEDAAAAAHGAKTRAASVVVDDIDRAINLIDNGMFTSGPGAEFVANNFAGTDAGDTSALLETIKSNLGMDRLQAMRDSSPTGGALGAINKSEMDLLQAAYGNLRLSQSKGQLKDNLNRVKNIYLDIVHGQGGGPERAKLSYMEASVPETSQVNPAGQSEEYRAKMRAKFPGFEDW